MNKIQNNFFCFVYSFPVVSQYCCYVNVFNIPYFSLAQYLENVCIQRSPSLVKNSDTYTKYTHEYKPSERESTILTLKYSKMQVSKIIT